MISDDDALAKLSRLAADGMSHEQSIVAAICLALGCEIDQALRISIRFLCQMKGRKIPYASKKEQP